MKKQLKNLLTAIFAMVMVLSLAACGKEEITITFMNGDATLGTVVTEAGSTVTGYEAYETVEGYEFLGWFETPTFLASSKVDLSTV